MNETPIVNFHVGATRIQPDLVDIALRSTSLRKHLRAVKVISTKEFQKKIRAPVNAKNDLEVYGSISSAEFREFRDHLSENELVVASQHAMLGHPKDALKSGQILPKAERRLRRLGQVFDSMVMTLHLAIGSQLDFLTTLVGELPPSELDSVRDGRHIPSWADLALRARKAIPDRQLVVWDFEEPRRTIIPFLSVLLGTEPELFDAELRKKLRDASDEYVKRTRVLQRITPWPVHTVAKLDERYEADLIQLEMIKGVRLVRSNQVAAGLEL